MLEKKKKGVIALACAVSIVAAGPVAAQGKPGGKIVCWKDKSGKVVGCGDTVPPEYQQGATKELDKRGITRGTTESVEEAARQRAHTEEMAKQKAENDRRVAEQRRHDAALLGTYANDQEIDSKRDRELQVIDLQVTQIRVTLKNASDRYKDAKSRLDISEKSKKGGTDALREEVARASEDVRRIEQSIVAKEKEKDEIRTRYAEYKKRYTELRGTAQPSSSATASRK